MEMDIETVKYNKYYTEIRVDEGDTVIHDEDGEDEENGGEKKK